MDDARMSYELFCECGKRLTAEHNIFSIPNRAVPLALSRGLYVGELVFHEDHSEPNAQCREFIENLDYADYARLLPGYEAPEQ